MQISIDDLLLAWWKDQWGAAPVAALIEARAKNGAPDIDATEVALMKAAEELHNGERHSAPAICEQMAQNLLGNAINCQSRSLRIELEMCADTAMQCALSIRHGRPITDCDKAVSAAPKRHV